MRLLIIILSSMILGSELTMNKYNIEDFNWFIVIISFVLVTIYLAAEKDK